MASLKTASGRSFTFIIVFSTLCLTALKITDETKVLTPANWNEGDDVLMPHFPYTADELTKNPEIKDNFYSVGDRLWFKKITK